jgi:L,D-transpeptidase catalytic domain
MFSEEDPNKDHFMHNKYLQITPISKYRVPGPLLCVMALCFLLLSACSSISIDNNTKTNTASTPTALPSPTIDPTLQNQGDIQLQTFQQWIDLMQTYNGNTSTYTQQYNSDQQSLQQAKTSASYKVTLATLHSHVMAIQLPAMKAESLSLQQQLQQEVSSWGQKHKFHDTFNNTIYPLGFEYGPTGIGAWLQNELSSAQTLADYQQAIEDLNMYLTNFQALTTNSSDKTPYNKVHKTDIQLLQHYGMMNTKAIVISLSEQAMRVYQNGKLVNSFLVTTGRPDKPSPPGTWWVEGKKSPTVFKANVPQSSPYWYPDTPINYAIQYHSNGYFIHDSWWRADYGPGTQFPHQDSSGDIFSSQGSHGCVNMAKDDANWVYNYVEVFTHIVIY